MKSLVSFIYGLNIFEIFIDISLSAAASSSKQNFKNLKKNHYHENEEEDSYNPPTQRKDNNYYEEYSRYYNNQNNNDDYLDENLGLGPPPPLERGQYYWNGGPGSWNYGDGGGYIDVENQQHEDEDEGYNVGDGIREYIDYTVPQPQSSLPPSAGFHDPGFKVQSGFEGVMVPNKWYGLLPWGIEGVVIVIAGIIVFVIILIAIIGLIAWICGIKKVVPFLIKKEQELSTRWRDEWSQSLTNLSSNVYNALDKFSIINDDDDEEIT